MKIRLKDLSTHRQDHKIITSFYFISFFRIRYLTLRIFTLYLGSTDFYFSICHKNQHLSAIREGKDFFENFSFPFLFLFICGI